MAFKGIEYEGQPGTIVLNPVYAHHALCIKGIDHLGWNKPTDAVGIWGRNATTIVMPITK